MSDSDSNQDKIQDYAVGYAKPPEQHRFKPGNTHGKGRTTGSKNYRTIIEEEVFAPISFIDKDQKRKTAPAIQLILRQRVTAALGGDHRSVEMLTRQIAVHCPQPEPEGDTDELTDLERQILGDETRLAKLLKGESQHG